MSSCTSPTGRRSRTAATSPRSSSLSGLLVAGLGSRFFGIPLALAAFVAGLAITECKVAAEARQRLLPFRDVFAVMQLNRSRAAIGLGQIGEFSYVLGVRAVGTRLISKEVSAALISAVVISIAASSVLVRFWGGTRVSGAA